MYISENFKHTSFKYSLKPLFVGCDPSPCKKKIKRIRAKLQRVGLRCSTRREERITVDTFFIYADTVTKKMLYFFDYENGNKKFDNRFYAFCHQVTDCLICIFFLMFYKTIIFILF